MTLTILPFAPALAAEFDAINRAWIEDAFVIEPHDEEVLSDPQTHIIAPGGTILFVADDSGAILGTGALMPTGGGAIELTKMGVRKEARGTGAGSFLLAALIERGHAMGAAPLYLLTNAKQATAVRLYERTGFVHDAEIMATYGATYERCNVAMRHTGAMAGPVNS